MIAAGSSAEVAADTPCAIRLRQCLKLVDVTPPQNHRRPTVTFHFARGNFRRNNTRAAWAGPIPTNPSGSTADKHRTRFRRPKPGSTSTITIPARNNPNTSATNSIPGRTMSVSRVPCGTPHANNPRSNPRRFCVKLCKCDHRARVHDGDLIGNPHRNRR